MSEPHTLPLEVRRARRSGARLAATQACYQLEATGQSLKSVIRDFMEDRLGLGPEGIPIEDADPDLFKAIVNTVVEQQADIDAAITRHLAKGWRMARLDATTRAMVRCASGELLTKPELSVSTIIEEYVGIAHAFFEGNEPGFVNGLLDSVAKDVRS